MRCLLILLMTVALQCPSLAQGARSEPTKGAQGKSRTIKNAPSPSSALPNPVTKPPAQWTSPSPTPIDHNQSTPAETFSQLTLFLFGSGLALFVALLGWSDQIRGINKDTKDLESKFLENTKIRKDDFLAVVKVTAPAEQLHAIANLMGSERLTTVSSVELLSLFKKWNEQWGDLERLSSRKYDLTIALTVSLFLAGVASLFTNAKSHVRIWDLCARTEVLLLAVPMLFVAALIRIMILASKRERRFKDLLNEIEEKV